MLAVHNMLDRDTPASGTVALVLAGGVAVALNIITCAVMLAAFMGRVELSANSTQLLTGWGGGIIGVLGSYIGFTFGQRKSNGPPPPPAEAPPAEAEPYQPMGGQQ